MQRFEEEIGKGMFGVVHRAINVQTGQIVAVKEVNVDQVDPAKLPNIMVPPFVSWFILSSSTFV